MKSYGLSFISYIKILAEMLKRNKKCIAAVSFCLCIIIYQLVQLINLSREYRVYSARIDNIEQGLPKTIHFSVDDAINIFEDLTKNENKYSSIYENKTLRQLKEFHDLYGLKVELYCFLKYGDFSLENCTSKFASQFMDASDWLSFGFHGYCPEVKEYENEAEFRQYYDEFLFQISRICMGGGYHNCKIRRI